MIFVLVLLAHSWYPTYCCERGHCHPVPCSEIKSIGDYWVWGSYDWRKDEAKISPDGLCHVCVGGTIAYCLFLGEDVS